MNILENVSLKPYTSIRIGGPARFFCIIKNESELNEALEFANKNELKIYILGGGTNCIFPDNGVDGLVIKISNTEFEKSNNNFIVGAGIGLGYIAQESVKHDLVGAEWCAAVPGTLGGAIYGNAGAFGGEMKDIIEMVEYIDVNSKGICHKTRLKNIESDYCEFDYRSSIFKRNTHWIIWRAHLNLKKGDTKKSKNLINGYVDAKKNSQDLSGRSAGCAFKNPKAPSDKKQLAFLQKRLELKDNDFQELIKTGYISAGFLLDRLGLKGKNIGGLKVSEKHANFFINHDAGTAEDFIILMSLVKEKVRNHYDIQLQEEIQLIGF